MTMRMLALSPNPYNDEDPYSTEEDFLAQQDYAQPMQAPFDLEAERAALQRDYGDIGPGPMDYVPESQSVGYESPQYYDQFNQPDYSLPAYDPWEGYYGLGQDYQVPMAGGIL